MYLGNARYLEVVLDAPLKIAKNRENADFYLTLTIATESAIWRQKSPKIVNLTIFTMQF